MSVSVYSVFSMTLLVIGAGKNEPGHAFGQFEDMEIDDPSQRDVEEFHIAEQLSLMDRMHPFDGLDLNEQTSVDQLSDISAISCSINAPRTSHCRKQGSYF